jgi:hypothetical protein
VTAADHANTVREMIGVDRDTSGDTQRAADAALAALDALLAQAETAEEATRVANEMELLAEGAMKLKYKAEAALAAREEAWTHEDRMVLGEGGC